MNMFWSHDPKCVESDATAVEPSPHRLVRRMRNVALVISIAMRRAASTLR